MVGSIGSGRVFSGDGHLETIMRQRFGRESRGYREARDEADTYGRRGYGADWEEQDDEGRVGRYDTRSSFGGSSEREREDVYPFGGPRYSEGSRRYESGEGDGGGGGWGWRSGPDSYTRPSMSRGGWGSREGGSDESYPGERYGERSRQQGSGSRGWRSEDRYGSGSQWGGGYGGGPSSSYGGSSGFGGGTPGYGGSGSSYGSGGGYGSGSGYGGGSSGMSGGPSGYGGGSYTEGYRSGSGGGGTYGVGGLQSGSWGTSGSSGWNRPMGGGSERHGSEGMLGERSSFRGRGPKGYTRSDERIREDVNDRLTDEDSIDASEIEVTVESGEVTLSGSVPDREMKRRVEDLVESLSGVKNVQNNLRVKKDVSISERGSERERSNDHSSSSSGSRTSSASSATAGFGSKSNR